MHTMDRMEDQQPGGLSSPRFVPVLPDSAPFTPEQRAYLNGFLAGLFSYAPVSGANPAGVPTAEPLLPLMILFGSQTGNAEKLAKRIAKEAGKRGFAPAVHDLAGTTPAQLTGVANLLVVTSTYGDGEPPDNAKAFWKNLQTESAPTLAHSRYAVCALGDSSYPRFCQFGRDLDARLEALGARRVYPRQDCDVEYDQAFAQWLDVALASFGPGSASGDPSAIGRGAAFGDTPTGNGQRTTDPSWSRANPYPARLMINHRLSGVGSGKDIRHLEIALGDSGLEYQPGDALGVWPTNCPALVDDVLAALGCDGEEAVGGRDGAETSLRQALLRDYEIHRTSVPLLQAAAGRSADHELKRFATGETNGDATRFLHGRDVLDLLRACPQAGFSANDFVALLRKLQPRLYSISSSAKAHPGAVHLTVSTVRYEARDRVRKGVCSTFLAERVGPDAPLPVFLHPNAAFRPPAPEVPLIMIGPGTGIAPFRAFLEERRAIGARGRNWLFFGDQREATDFLYRVELEEFLRDGLLNRLDLAWSRDQPEKIYVQHRMLDQAAELWRWIDEGAAVYVCGDAVRMARDVDEALALVVQRGGGRTSEQAGQFLDQLRAARRYQRDVY